MPCNTGGIYCCEEISISLSSLNLEIGCFYQTTSNTLKMGTELVPKSSANLYILT